MLPIKNNIIGTAYFFNAVNWKAGHLIKTDEQIGNDEWNYHRINNWTCNQVLRTVCDQPAKKIPLKPTVCFFDRLFKLNTFSLDLKIHAGWLLAKRDAKIIFKRVNLAKQLLNTIVHQNSNIKDLFVRWHSHRIYINLHQVCLIVGANKPTPSA